MVSIYCVGNKNLLLENNGFIEDAMSACVMSPYNIVNRRLVEPFLYC